MSINNPQLYVKEFINEVTVYPYTCSGKMTGIAIINNNTTTAMTVTLNTSPAVTIPVPASGIFEDIFNGFTTVTHAGGTDFDIALKRS